MASLADDPGAALVAARVQTLGLAMAIVTTTEGVPLDTHTVTRVADGLWEWVRAAG